MFPFIILGKDSLLLRGMFVVSLRISLLSLPHSHVSPKMLSLSK
jgi:hypothetical protein